ncbi:glycosyltransferase [Wenyingzhuangia sp. chi5]|uniref:Glycosyltransferase n=1 Tax=Wenyingzhuangia gilva TaxID=3057677 RepID=A0ABT8VPF7_9FLAO|nr:glycosyltransferase [Wenyingzhuangia sp. chi5]MDO3693837.1 glycosyltransferase [Wenyingzhuangia sp. chi5]
MISICIPVYNYDITKLVKALTDQMDLLDEKLELIVIDDGSETFKTTNRNCLKEHVYVELPKNVGRSKIRNLFKDYAKNQFLLFLDCDSMAINNCFITNYLKVLKEKIVVYGGRVYLSELSRKEEKLSWMYGRNIEAKPLKERLKHPYLTFMTNNFLIDKNIFNTLSFNEEIIGYGHEDTLFGYELMKSKIEIKHIDNPVLNMDLESNKIFIEKMEEALHSLKKISLKLENDVMFYEHVRLLCFYKKLNFIQRESIGFIFLLTNKLLKYFLLQGYYANKLIGFYKIGYFIKIRKIS